MQYRSLKLTSPRKKSGLPILVATEKQRDRRGMTLASVLIMGVVITLFLGAMYSGLMPVYQRVASLRYNNVLRATNEAAQDYVLDQINTGKLSLSSIAVGSSTTITSFPATVTQQGSGTGNVSVKISNLGNAPPTSCILYDSNRAANNDFYSCVATTTFGGVTKTLTSLYEPIPPGGTTSYYATFGAFGVTTVEFVGLAGINGYNLPTGWTNPYQFADVGTLGAGNQVGTGAVNRGTLQAGSQFEFPVTQTQFNNAVQFTETQFNASAVATAPWAQIMGNIYSNGNDAPTLPSGYIPRSTMDSTGASQSVANIFGAANGLAINSAGVPQGAASGSTSGVPTGIQSSSSTNSSSQIPFYGSTPNSASFYPNWGNPGVTGSTTNPNTGGIVDSEVGYTPPTIPQAPGAPAGTPNLGNLTVNGTLNIVDGATLPSSIGTIAAGSTVNIPPGNYSMSTLSVGSSGAITVNNSTSGTPTNFFVNPPSSDTGNGAPAAVSFANGSNVNMNGITGEGFNMNGSPGFGATPSSGNNSSMGGTVSQLGVAGAGTTATPIVETSGSCNNLVINTNSDCNMVLAGNARGLVNAPNASVNVGAQTTLANDSNFYGSIVAGVTCVISSYTAGGGAYMHYDLNLKRAATGGVVSFSDPWAFTSSNSGNGVATQFRSVTWQEK